MKLFAIKFKFLIILYLFLQFISSCNVQKGAKLFGWLPLPFSQSRDIEKRYVFENTSAVFTNEFGRQASFTIRLSKKPDSDVILGPIVSSNPAEGIILTATSITFTKDNFDVPVTVTLQGVADGIADGNQQYRVRFGAVQSGDYSYATLAVPDVLAINTDRETPSIAATPAMGLFTNESGQTASMYVVLSTQPGADVVISGFSSDTISECTVSGSLTFTSNNWDVPQIVTIVGVNDFLLDGPQNCLITSSPSTSIDQVYVNKTIPVVTVVNVDNDTAGLTYIPITPATTTESGLQAQFSVIMNTTPTGTVTVTGITTTDSTEGNVSPANIAFTASDWNIPQTMTLTGIDDSMNDGDITYSVVFPNSVALDPMDAPYNNLAIASHGSFTNQDNDTRGFSIIPLAPTTSLTPLTVTEGQPSQTFQVRLTSVPCNTPSTPNTCSPASVTINLTNSNATQYTIAPSSLTFTPGNWNVYQTITVTAVNDSIDDDDFDFILSLDSILSTTDYGGLNPSDVAIRVIDNDTSGFTINPAGGVTVNENDPGGTGLETTITVVLNSEPTGIVTLGPIISTDTLEVTVAPTIGGGNTPINNRTLVFTPTAGQAIVNSDANADTFNETSTGGWNVPQTVRVRAVVDGTSDGTQTRAIQFGNRSTSDVKYANVGLTPTPDVAATNVDSGIPTILLQSISAVTFNEDGTSTITAQIVLATLPTATVTISNIVSSDTTEGVVLQNGGALPISNRTLVFNTTTNLAPTGTNTTTGGWNMPQTITIRSVTDSFDDGNIPFRITFPGAIGSAEYTSLLPTSANAAYNGGTGELTLTNIDDDTRGITTTATNPVSITEGGASPTFTIRLNSDPCSTPATPATCLSTAVTLNLTNNDTAQYTVSPTSLTFGAGTWNTPQTITLTPINDNIDEIANMDMVLVVNSFVSTSDYGGFDPADINVRVIDNDTRAINLTLTTGYSTVTSSGGGFTEYNMTLGSSPAAGNTVTVTASVPVAAPQEGKILASDNITQLDTRAFTFTSANWNIAQVFRVRGITGSGTGNTNFILTASAVETGTLPPPGFTALTYNNYNSLSTTQTITNYHIGAGKKIRLAGATTTITEATPTATFFWVLLNQAPTANVTINFGIDATYPCTLPASVGSTGQFIVNTPSLVLTSANWDQISNSNRVQITANNDLVDDGDSICPLRITSVSSADPYYSGLTTPDYNEPSIRVTDNDSRGILKQTINPLISGRLITSRTGASGSLQYSLNSQPMTNVTLTFTASAGTASFAPTNLTFTPANYAAWQSVTVTGNAVGALADNNYTVTATGTSTETATGYANGAIYNTYTDSQNATNRFLTYDLVPCTGPAVGTCSAINATGGTVAGTYTTTEAGGARYFAIALRFLPSSNVTIPISSSNTAEGTVSTASLVFTPANWNTLQVVTITGVDDAVADGTASYNIIFGAMTGNAAFTATIPSLNATNTDNDTVGFVLTPASITGVLESNLGGSFTVRLNSQPTASVSIPLTVNVPTAPDTGLTITSGTPLVFTTLNWNTPQTVNFTWAYDGTNLPATRDHSVILGVATSADASYAINPPDYTISIINSGL